MQPGSVTPGGRSRLRFAQRWLEALSASTCSPFRRPAAPDEGRKSCCRPTAAPTSNRTAQARLLWTIVLMAERCKKARR